MNRLDRLLNEYNAFSKKYSQLSYAEQLEFQKKMGTVQPLKIKKIKSDHEQLPENDAESPQTLDLILVESPANQEQYEELTTSAREEGIVLDEEHMFLFYHARPKWIKDPQQIIDAQERYIAEFLCQKVITIQIGYDRSKLVDLFKSILILGAINHSFFNSEESASPFQIDNVVEAIIRGDNYDRYISEIAIKWNAGTSQELSESLEAAAQAMRRQLSSIPGWLNCFEEIDNYRAAEIESGFTSTIALKIIDAIKRYFLDLGTGIWSPNGEVPRDLYDFLSHDKLTFTRPRSRGGSNANYNLNGLLDFYKKLLPFWQQAKRDAHQAQHNPIKKSIWRELIRGYGLPDDLIEWLNKSEDEKTMKILGYSEFTYLQEKLKSGYALTKPSELALEHSARLCGVPPYYYSVSYLFEHLPSKQNR
jgi:hypothetical protein